MNDVASTNIYLNVQSVLQEAKKDYYKGTKKDVAIVVDEQDFLPPDGWVVLWVYAHVVKRAGEREKKKN